MSDMPAKIAFGEDEGYGEVQEGFDPLGDEVIEEAPRRAAETKKKGKAPAWIFLVGGVILVVGVVAAGLGIMAMKKHRSAQTEIVFSGPPQAQPQPQPVIEKSEPAAVANSLPMPPAPVMPAQVAVPPVNSAATAPSAPVSALTAPMAQQAKPAGPAVASPIVAPANPEPAQGGAARLATLQEQMTTLASKLEEINKRLAKLEASDTAKHEMKKPAPAAPAKPVAKPVMKPVAKPPVLKAPVKPAERQVSVTQPQPAAAQSDKPSAEPLKPAASASGLQGYSISSIIGNRAWLIKRNADGSETEMSVAPGERVEGRVVTSVDGAAKAVVLEGGQRITVRR